MIVLLSLVGLVVAGAFLLGKRGGRLDAMRADAAVCFSFVHLLWPPAYRCLLPLICGRSSAVLTSLQAGALVDSDLDEEDENAMKIRETVALARGLCFTCAACRIACCLGSPEHFKRKLATCPACCFNCREGERLARHGRDGHAGPLHPGLVHQPRRHCATRHSPWIYWLLLGRKLNGLSISGRSCNHWALTTQGCACRKSASGTTAQTGCWGRAATARWAS